MIVIIFLACTQVACGQRSDNQYKDKIAIMDTTKLINKTVRSAIEAWQQGDPQKWLSHFTSDAKLLDDGRPRDFHKFSTEAIGHEKFTSFDKVEDNGLSVYGKFHSDTWGNFKTYFKFHIDTTGRIHQLEIGQADY